MKLFRFPILSMLASTIVFLGVGAANGQISLPNEIIVREGRIAKIEAKSDRAVKWINLHDDIDLVPDSSGKWAIIIGVKAGRYRIAAYSSSPKGEPTDPAYCTIIVEGSGAPKPPPSIPPTKPVRIQDAIVKLRFGSSGCTATIIGPRRKDGRWDVLTAAHCTGKAGERGEITLSDGRRFPVTVVVRNTTCDISWMVAEFTEDWPSFALLARQNPELGVSVWHQGYGVDKPGNREEGTVTAPQDARGQIKFHLSVSSGDSGSGIFRSDSNELVGVVCCTAARGQKADMWGGSCRRAEEMRSSNTSDAPILDYINPIPILAPRTADAWIMRWEPIPVVTILDDAGRPLLDERFR